MLNLQCLGGACGRESVAKEGSHRGSARGSSRCFRGAWIGIRFNFLPYLERCGGKSLRRHWAHYMRSAIRQWSNVRVSECGKGTSSDTSAAFLSYSGHRKRLFKSNHAWHQKRSSLEGRYRVYRPRGITGQIGKRRCARTAQSSHTQIRDAALAPHGPRAAFARMFATRRACSKLLFQKS